MCFKVPSLIVIFSFIFTCLPFSITPAQSDTPPTLELVTTLGHGWVHDIFWSPDGQQFYVVANQNLLVYPAGEWATPQIIPAEKPALVDAVLSEDGSIIVLLEKNLLRALDTQTWAEIWRAETEYYNTYGGYGITLGRVGDYLIHGADQNFAQIYDFATGALLFGASYIPTAAMISKGDTLFTSEAIWVSDGQDPPMFGYRYLEIAQLTATSIEALVTQEDTQPYAYLSNHPFMTIRNITGADFDPSREQVVAVANTYEGQGRILLDAMYERSTTQEFTFEMPLDGVAWLPNDENAIVLGMCVENLTECPTYQLHIFHFDLADELMIPLPLPVLLPGQVTALRFNPAGDHLAATNGNVVHLWDLTTQTEIAVLHGFSQNVTEMAWVGDNILAARSSIEYGPDLGVTLWDMQNFTSIGYVPCAGGIATHANLLVCGAEIWQIEDGVAEKIQDITGLTGEVIQAAFHPAGTQVALITYRFEARSGVSLSTSKIGIVLWDMAQAAAVVIQLQYVYPIQIGFSADGQSLFTLINEDYLVQWESVALLNETTPITLKDDFSTNEDRWTDGLPAYVTLHEPGYKTFAIHPAENLLLLNRFRDGVLLTYDPATQQILYETPLFGWTDVMFPHALTYNTAGTQFAGAGCSMAPHGGFCTESIVKVYDAPTGEWIGQAIRETDRVASLAFSPDHQYLVSGHVPLDGNTAAQLVADAILHVWQTPE